MAAPSALTQAVCSRTNIPYGANNTTPTLLQQFAVWQLKDCLLNQATTGTLTGTRTGASVWTCLGSSDGSGAGAALDGVDRWTTTFTPSKLVSAASGTSHSWIVLQNTSMGYQMCIDLNSASQGYVGIFATKITTPFINHVSSNQNRPVTVGFAEELCVGNTSPSLGSSFFMVADTVTAGTNYAHFTTMADGTFHYTLSRAGAGAFHSITAFGPATGGHVSDTRNVWLYGHGLAASRGAGSGGQALGAGTSFTRRHPDGGSGTGGALSVYFGSTQLLANAKTIDYLTTQYPAMPLYLALTSSTLAPDRFVWCGLFPDWFVITDDTVGASYPTTGAQERVLVGNLLLPWNGTVPIL